MRTRLLLVGAAVLVAGLLLPSPAHGGVTACSQGNAANAPDGRIRQGNQIKGNGLYPEHSFERVLPAGAKTSFVLRWKNRSGTTRDVQLFRDEAEVAPGYRVRFFVGGVKVTDDITNGGLSFAGIAPNRATPKITMVVKNTVQPIDTEVEFVRGTFAGAPQNRCDRVGAVVNRKIIQD
jgi:hypothetical protein